MYDERLEAWILLKQLAQDYNFIRFQELITGEEVDLSWCTYVDDMHRTGFAPEGDQKTAQ